MVSGPLALGLVLTTAFGAWWDGGRSKRRPRLMEQADELLRRAGGDRSGGSAVRLGDLADQAGPRLAQALGQTREGLEPLVRAGSRLAQTRAAEVRPEEIRQRAAELGSRVAETATTLGTLAAGTATTVGPAVGRLAGEAGGALGEAAVEVRRATFRTIRNLAITAALGGVIVYIYAPEREQQQQLLETVQGVAFGLVDFGRGVQQLVNDLRAS